MSVCRLGLLQAICLVTFQLCSSTSTLAASTDGVFVVYARTTSKDVKLVRYITEFDGVFPASLLTTNDVTLVCSTREGKNVVLGSRPTFPAATLDSIVDWLVPFNPMKVDTFGIAVRVMPLRQAILDGSRVLGSPHAKLVSQTPWYRKELNSSASQERRRAMLDISLDGTRQEPTFSLDTLGTYIIYPAEARGRDLQGTVVVSAHVDEQGFVDDIVIVESSHPVFEQSAARAVKCLRMRPGTLYGAPSPMWVTIPISFVPTSLEK